MRSPEHDTIDLETATLRQPPEHEEDAWTGPFPIFLSVVFVVRDEASRIEDILGDAIDKIAAWVSDFDLIVVDNASDDTTVDVLRKLTSEAGLPNLQIYALTKQVDADTAAWVGLENALGDFVAVADPFTDDISFLLEMIGQAVSGADVVFASNDQQIPDGVGYRAANSVFNGLYRSFSRVDLAKDAPRYRLLSKSVVNFILQHHQPAMTYRHLPATGGFARVNLSYSTTPRASPAKPLGRSIDRGMRQLVAATRTPMRLATVLCLFGALANLIYSLYVIAIAVAKDDIGPGWVSLSLQQSGMFLLISVVLLVLSEYILHTASSSSGGPLYHVGQEFTSSRMTRYEKLNIEDSKLSAARSSETAAGTSD